MAVVALHSAATGLSALSTQIDVIANNLANVNTHGFKASRVNFEDLLYEEKAQPGVENANGDERPAGTFVGLGVRISNTQFDFAQGSTIATDSPLDLMIEGEGFYQVDILEESGTGIGYTRAGNFFPNSEGELVLGNADGPRLEPPIQLPDGYESINISKDGIVSVTLPGAPEQQEVGQIELATFINGGGLKPIGGNIFVESAASGPPIVGNPGDQNIGRIRQGAKEASNVDPVRELVDLIKAQRSFEMNSQTIQAADQTLQVISNLRR